MTGGSCNQMKQYEQSALKPEYRGNSNEHAIIFESKGTIIHSFAPGDLLDSVLEDIMKNDGNLLRIFGDVSGKYGSTICQLSKFRDTEEFVSELEKEILVGPDYEEIPHSEVLTRFDNNYNFFQNNVLSLIEENTDLVGKAVAIKDGSIIDSDDSEEALTRRVQGRYGNIGNIRL